MDSVESSADLPIQRDCPHLKLYSHYWPKNTNSSGKNLPQSAGERSPWAEAYCNYKNTNPLRTRKLAWDRRSTIRLVRHYPGITWINTQTVFQKTYSLIISPRQTLIYLNFFLILSFIVSFTIYEIIHIVMYIMSETEQKNNIACNVNSLL